MDQQDWLALPSFYKGRGYRVFAQGSLHRLLLDLVSQGKRG
jgi:hypothetical protein